MNERKDAPKKFEPMCENGIRSMYVGKCLEIEKVQIKNASVERSQIRLLQIPKSKTKKDLCREKEECVFDS